MSEGEYLVGSDGADARVMGLAECPVCGQPWEDTFVLGFDRSVGQPRPVCSTNCKEAR